MKDYFFCNFDDFLNSSSNSFRTYTRVWALGEMIIDLAELILLDDRDY